MTDPPYGLQEMPSAGVAATLQHWLTGDTAYTPTGAGFMGNSWDRFVPPPATWAECLRVLKPGGHLLAFGGARTYDLLTISMRLAGFEIKDSIDWLYAQGMPMGGNLKPAHEPIVIARKPVRGSRKANVAEWGTGALNIKACRIPCKPGDKPAFPVGDYATDSPVGSRAHRGPQPEGASSRQPRDHPSPRVRGGVRRGLPG